MRFRLAPVLRVAFAAPVAPVIPVAFTAFAAPLATAFVRAFERGERPELMLDARQPRAYYRDVDRRAHEL